jgi:glycosyltransferase involved in cell wall biosynthesis
MKICMLTTAYPRWSGDERAPFIHEAARALRESGIEVVVLAMHRPGTKTHEYIDGIEVIRTRYLPEKWEILQEEGGGIPLIWKRRPFARLALIPFAICQSIMLLKHSSDCDIIHSNWTLSGLIAWITQFVHHRPFLVTVHGSDIYIGTKTVWIRSLTKILLNQANAVIAISRDLSQTLVRLGISEDKITVIPEVIDIDRFLSTEQNRENIILFVGSLIPRKGCKYLIQAFSEIAKSFPNYQLSLVGDGPDKSELIGLVSDLQLGKNVHFLGSKSRDEIPILMGQARLFVLPSLEEGLGVVLLEAIASATPCVASCIGGIPDIITQDVGVLVPPGDSEALSSAILGILNHEERWDELSRHARERALSEFRRDSFSEKFKKVYAHILAKSAQ